MANKKNTNSKTAKNNDQNLVEPNNYLETQKDHKEWYNIHEMGKMRGKPTNLPREIKKPGGTKKHSLRKEI